jgi:V/A-type H+-transporting ATPase subunit I
MSVERMEKVSIVGHMDEIDDIARLIILSSSVHMVNAITDIHENNFPILNAKQDVDAVIDYNYIKQYTSQKNLSEVKRKLDAIFNIFNLKRNAYMGPVKDRYDFNRDLGLLNRLYEKVEETHERYEELLQERKELTDLEGYISCIKNADFNLKEAMDMKYINVKFGRLTQYSMDRLKKNYENISAIAFKLKQDNENVTCMFLVPEPVEIEVDRVLVSLGFNELKVNVSYDGTPSKWLSRMELRDSQIDSEIESLRAELDELKQKYGDDVEGFNSRLMMDNKIEELKSYIACTNEFFYLTGWVPRYKKKLLSQYLKEYEDNIIIVYKDASDSQMGIDPPTCLKNNYITRPFEAVVRLYGIPSYKELDPTAFLGISYMLLFGAMFGDVGQGLVLFIIGEILLRVKHRPNLGGVFARLGLSSTVFGFLYGSVFGFEDIINAILVKPMDSINSMLIGTVIFGVGLLIIGYVFSLINAYKIKDFENGLFDKNGASGMLFYILLLYLVVGELGYVKLIIPAGALIIILIVLMALILFKEPLAHALRGIKPLYNEKTSDYYIEGGFGVIETLLSLFSNTVSFVRVGAFAINHVGLFMAFDTLSEMASNGVASGLVLILGNIIIIGLEGLIVFIQGLRLEYYELFSKYFTGTGYEYNPFKINLKKERTFKVSR